MSDRWAVLLLVSAVLFAESFIHARSEDPALQRGHVLLIKYLLGAVPR